MEKRLLRRCGDERGQVLVLVAVGIVAMIGMVGLAVDIGYADWSQRALQSSADAAALAGAQSLPNPDKAAADAKSFSGSAADGGQNAQSNLPGVSIDVTTRCLASAPNCAPDNAIQVTENATVKTIFARVLGIDSFKITAQATACSPCGFKPLDIMLVLDRTGSMCQFSDGTADPACTDLDNAREGMETFIGLLNPKLDRIGFAVFPPAPSTAQACDKPSASTYDDANATYVVAPLTSDFPTVVSTIDCQQGGGSTAYATAIEQAQAELEADGRPGARNVIVFLSDGAANTGPSSYPDTSPYRTQPCEQGVTSAQAVAAKGTLVYSIGYDLDALGGGANVCQSFDGTREAGVACPRLASPITAMTALQCIASDADNFYNKPDPGQLNTIFSRIAADVASPSARLIQDDAQ